MNWSWAKKAGEFALVFGKHGAALIPVPLVGQLVTYAVDAAEQTGFNGKRKRKLAVSMVLNFISLGEALTGKKLLRNKKKVARAAGALIIDFVTFRNASNSWPKRKQ